MMGSEGRLHYRPRHVWVGTGSVRKPGVLIGWRQTADGWEGYVLHGWGGGAHEAGWSGGWLPAERIVPVVV